MTGFQFSPRRRQTAIALLALVTFSTAERVAQADWLHYRGPAQNGMSPEKGWTAKLPASGPKVLWKAALGTGTAGVTVSGDRAFSAGNIEGKDIIYCLDVKTGKQLWRHEYPLPLDPNMFEGGPRATPTVDGDRVYTVSHQGDLWCLDTSGKKLWSHHYQKDFGGRRPQWGYAGSATVEGNLVFLDVGGKGSSTVALDKTSGEVAWKSGDDEAGYASPVVATIGGVKTVVMFKAAHLVGLDAKDGHELWRNEWKTSYDVNAATPIVVGDRILITSGYNHGAALVEIKGGRAHEVWKNKELRSQINSPVIVAGSIFGIDGDAGNGNLVCVDFATGESKWTEKTVKGGSLIAADGKLLVLTSKGELVIAEALPSGFKPISRAQVMSKRCWVQPTLVNGRLFVKNNEGDLACLDLGAK